jgi:hypothetical protein
MFHRRISLDQEGFGFSHKEMPEKCRKQEQGEDIIGELPHIIVKGGSRVGYSDNHADDSAFQGGNGNGSRCFDLW